MDFTREPIIETIITPREGYRLVIRSSKSLGQEEHFVDAVEVVSFGNAFFYRSMERPKPFIVPIGDYEILEVREPRMVLKTAVQEGSVKIGAGNAPQRPSRDEARRESQRTPQRQREPQPVSDAEGDQSYPREGERQAQVQGSESRADRRRERRRGFRRRGRDGRDAGAESREGAGRQPREQSEQAEHEEFMPSATPAQTTGASSHMMEESFAPSPKETASRSSQRELPPGDQLGTSTLLRSVLPPPTTLVRDDLQRLRDSEVYRGAFFIREDAADSQDDDDSSLESTDSELAFHKHMQNQVQEKKESSLEEETFLFSANAENEIQPNASKDVP